MRNRRTLGAPNDGERAADDHGTIERGRVRAGDAVCRSDDRCRTSGGGRPDEAMALCAQAVHAKSARTRGLTGVRRIILRVNRDGVLVALGKHFPEHRDGRDR
jgi:hypothetical protein